MITLEAVWIELKLKHESLNRPPEHNQNVLIICRCIRCNSGKWKQKIVFLGDVNIYYFYAGGTGRKSHFMMTLRNYLY